MELKGVGVMPKTLRQITKRWEPPDAITAIAELRSVSMRSLEQGSDKRMAGRLFNCYRSLRRIGLSRNEALSKTWAVVKTVIVTDDITPKRSQDK